MEGGTEDLSEDEDDDEAETAITTPSSNGGFGGGFGGGWITPKNIGALKKSGNGEDEISEPVKVCFMALLFFHLSNLYGPSESSGLSADPVGWRSFPLVWPLDWPLDWSQPPGQALILLSVAH